MPIALRCGARLLAALVFAAAGGLAASTPARAASVVPLTLEEMGRAASDVFVATVESSEAGWDEAHRLIETKVRLRVERAVKGRAGRRVTLVVPGGVVGNVGMRAPGAPAYRTGERVLVLAEPGRPGELRTVGFYQGKLPIRRDPVRGIDVVEPTAFAWGAHGEPIPPGTVPERRPPPLPLDEVIGRLRALR